MSHLDKGLRGRSIGNGTAEHDDPRIETNDEREESIESMMARRRPVNGGLKLYVPEELLDKKKFYYRFVLGDPARIMQLKDGALYSQVTNHDGTPYVIQTKGGQMHYLMKLPLELRAHDDKLKREKTRAMMEGEAKLKANEYSPTGQSSAVSSAENSDPDVF